PLARHDNVARNAMPHYGVLSGDAVPWLAVKTAPTAAQSACADCRLVAGGRLAKVAAKSFSRPPAFSRLARAGLLTVPAWCNLTGLMARSLALNAVHAGDQPELLSFRVRATRPARSTPARNR
ncbi:MAG: hypothetical protein U9Q70_08205, partial [Chloroflexota bacterium]|nr:hypothetical protein [Chloroflexota bacterium]